MRMYKLRKNLRAFDTPPKSDDNFYDDFLNFTFLSLFLQIWGECVRNELSGSKEQWYISGLIYWIYEAHKYVLRSNRQI